MKINKLVIIPIILVLFFAGCTQKVFVPLTPDYTTGITSTIELASIDTPLQFIKGNFDDKRSDTSMYATFKQQAYTFQLFAERPVEEVIYNGLAVMLKKAGHSWSDGETGQIKVNLQLLSTAASRNAGMVMVGATSSIQIKLDFIDNNSNNLVYSQIYNGNDERSQALIGLMDMVKKSVDASIIDCINNVASDKLLTQALIKK